MSRRDHLPHVPFHGWNVRREPKPTATPATSPTDAVRGSTAGRAHSTRRRLDAVALVGGLAVLAVGMIVVRHGDVPGWERRTFHALNDLPDALYPFLWPFQQAGALGVGVIVALGALVAGRRRLAFAALSATVAKLALERAVKAAVTRERPGTSIGPDIHARGDVSLGGASFVSGHAILVTALAGVVAPSLPSRWRWVPYAVAATVLVARVYVGAHNPLDVVCGAGLGVALAGALDLTLGTPPMRDPEREATR